MSYSSKAPTANMDMLIDGKYRTTIEYKMVNKKMKVTSSYQNMKKDMLTVRTIDNGLYKVKLGEDRPFKVDLAQYYKKLNWKKLSTVQTRIKTKDDKWLILTTSKKNLYVSYGKYIFVINKKYIKK